MLISLPRNAQLWLPAYVKKRLTTRRAAAGASVWVMIADHWEPYWMRPSDEIAAQRVAVWAEHWPKIAQRHADSTGRPPQYTFFYPQEEYRPQFLDALAEMKRAGIADVEIHIHHDGEGQQNFVDRMNGFIETLIARHGLLRVGNGRPAFGFIHGNWALDNSRPDGRYCGLNNEITLLRDLGCYADFTMPSGSSPTQSRTINTIYWVIDDPLRPRSYDHGIAVEPGSQASGDLLMIPGPLGLRWAGRIVPRMEGGELACYDLPTPYRVERWLDLAPRIGNDIFVKLFAHGAQEQHSRALLIDGGLDRLFTSLAEGCRRRGHQLRYASAWEMRQAVDAAARGGVR
ncbi:MAG TPA: hypothetical protein VMB03_32640 [Bryobacteraceae bacterium]|nr:hypothetical protein [Bryobacteraceae bacterium]